MADPVIIYSNTSGTAAFGGNLAGIGSLPLVAGSAYAVEAQIRPTGTPSVRCVIYTDTVPAQPVAFSLQTVSVPSEGWALFDFDDSAIPADGQYLIVTEVISPTSSNNIFLFRGPQDNLDVKQYSIDGASVYSFAYNPNFKVTEYPSDIPPPATPIGSIARLRRIRG